MKNLNYTVAIIMVMFAIKAEFQHNTNALIMFGVLGILNIIGGAILERRENR